MFNLHVDVKLKTISSFLHTCFDTYLTINLISHTIIPYTQHVTTHSKEQDKRHYLSLEDTTQTTLLTSIQVHSFKEEMELSTSK